MIILYEETKIKDIDKNKDQYNFENSEMNSKIKRTFNSSGDKLRNGRRSKIY